MKQETQYYEDLSGAFTALEELIGKLCHVKIEKAQSWVLRGCSSAT